jgi:FIMAH domain
MARPQLQEAKQALSRGNVTAARGKLSDFESQVSTKSGQGIAPSAAQLLIADVDYVLGTLGSGSQGPAVQR